MHELTTQELIQELRIHGQLMTLHTSALACHCECLGMNAENCIAACNNSTIPYGDKAYLEVMQKWGLIDGEEKVII